jgi:hypothetical protein
VRRRSFVELSLLAAVIAAAVTAVAVLIPWLPVSASKQRDRIDLAFWLATGIAIMILLGRRGRDPVLGLALPGASGRRRTRRSRSCGRRSRRRL